MKLLNQYIDQLPEDLEFDEYKFVCKNIFYLNEDYKDILLEDLIRIDFNNLIPILL